MKAMRDALGLAVLLGAVALIASTLAGCGGPPSAVRRTVAASAIAVAELDARVAARVDDLRPSIVAQSTSWSDFDERLRPWVDLGTGLQVAQSSIYALDASLNAWDAGGSERWLGVAACAVSALEELMELAQAVGLAVPPEISGAVSSIGALAGSVCREGGD